MIKLVNSLNEYAISRYHGLSIVKIHDNKISETDESYFIGDVIIGAVELNINQIAITFKYKDSISIIDRSSKQQIKQVSIPSFFKRNLDVKELVIGKNRYIIIKGY
jgi:hypothetical protein